MHHSVARYILVLWVTPTCQVPWDIHHRTLFLPHTYNNQHHPGTFLLYDKKQQHIFLLFRPIWQFLCFEMDGGGAVNPLSNQRHVLNVKIMLRFWNFWCECFYKQKLGFFLANPILTIGHPREIGHLQLLTINPYQSCLQLNFTG